jgi:hypothetical protein
VIALVAIAGACSAAPAPTAAEYRRQVRKECRALRHDTAALPTPDPVATDRFVAAGRRALALERATLGRIRTLDAPSADDETVARWLADVDDALDAAAASLAAQAAGDFTTARAANVRGLRATLRADRVARSLGLDDCTAPAPG